MFKRRTVLLLGEDKAVSRVFRQTIGNPPHVEVVSIALDGSFPDTAISELNRFFPDDRPGPNLVVATSEIGWQIVRLLNVWTNESVFDKRARGSRGKRLRGSNHEDRDWPDIQAVPVCGLPLNSIFDQYTARGINPNAWLQSFVDVLRGSENIVDAKTLRTAIRHYCMATERHQLKIVGVSHESNDLHAVCRIIQGATLQGWISVESGREACCQALAIAKEGGLIAAATTADKLIDTSESEVMASSAIRAATTPFASLLVVDDQGFWGKPLDRLWRGLGFEVSHVAAHAEGLSHLERQRSLPIRAVILDLRSSGDEFAGAKFLSSLTHRQRQNTPVVVLSVHDRFSETVHLKRLGAFSYLNKHALAEQGPGRDALSAFRQVRDAVLTAAFASLAADCEDLWATIAITHSRVLETERLRRGMAPPRDDKTTQCMNELGSQMPAALDVLADEWRRLFHSFWQDSQYPAGVACRQVIRALGIVHDKWCSFWTEFRFDPDGEGHRWSYGVNIHFAQRVYHGITTAIRGEASHGMVDDDTFEWCDVWIMLLTLLLKVEGTCRLCAATALSKSEADSYADDVEKRLNEIVVALGGLLTVSGEINEWETVGDSEDAIRARLTNLGTHLRQRLDECRAAQFPYGQGDAKRVTVAPYLSIVKGNDPVSDQMWSEFVSPARYSRGQLRAHLLCLLLIHGRVLQSG